MIVNVKLVKDIIEIEIELKEIGFTFKSTVKNGEKFLMPFVLTDVDLLNQITKGVNGTIDYIIERNKDDDRYTDEITNYL